MKLRLISLALLPFGATTSSVKRRTCRVCPDGSAVAFPNLSLPAASENDTCSELDASLISLAHRDCVKITSASSFDVVRTYCGCPGFEPNCTLCEDGSALRNGSFSVFANSDCQSLQQLLPVSYPDSCSAIQATAGVYW